ncbi:MAG: hypothetical protein KatS3mg131_3945 [Candidatus Tectimicrobiota bacterium]|nr:MAG: hypothetical protein KatS3mg131_3945 [Candidatus Tectomicrobia bacterium]
MPRWVDGVERGRQSIDLYRVGRTALQRMAQELAAAVWFADDPRTVLRGENGEVAGQARDRVRFVTAPYRRFSLERPEGELCAVAYFIDTDAAGRPALWRAEDCTLAAEQPEEVSKVELTDAALGLDVTYYDAEGEYEAWPPHGAEEGPLPCRVRLALTLQGRRQEGLVFITTVALPLREKCGEE